MRYTQQYVMICFEDDAVYYTYFWMGTGLACIHDRPSHCPISLKELHKSEVMLRIQTA